MTSRAGAAGRGVPGRLRIIGGSRRGRFIRVPRGDVRPTSEMVRGALFNALGPVTGLVVLDLFAGSGALGLEALSRGASSCVFVESDAAVATVLKENIRLLDFGGASRVVVSDYRQAVKSQMEPAKGFDLLFVDPPYRILAEVEGALTPFVASLLGESGAMVIESDSASQASFGLATVFARTYGDTKITMVVRKRSLD